MIDDREPGRPALLAYLQRVLEEQTNLRCGAQTLSRLWHRLQADGTAPQVWQPVLRELQALVHFVEFQPVDFQRALYLQAELQLTPAAAEHVALCERLQIQQLLSCQPRLYDAVSFLDVQAPA